MKTAILKPIIQGKVDMTYPHAGETVKIVRNASEGMSWEDPDDPLYEVEYKNKDHGWWNKRDLESIK